MNATFDLPEELLREAEVKAASEKRLVSELVEEGLCRILGRLPQARKPGYRIREDEPLIRVSPDHKFPILSNDEMAELLESQGERLP